MSASDEVVNSTEESPRGGQLVIAGCCNWSVAGRTGEGAKFDGRKEYNLLGFRKISSLSSVRIKYVISGPIACHTLAISEEGALYAWGRNEDYQLGLKDTVNRYNPTLVSLGEDKKAAGGACGPNHTLVFTTNGELFSWGNDKCGQCGLGRKYGSVKSPSETNLTSVVSVAAGRDFSVAATSSGKIYTWGTPENGQLGNGTDGKTLEKAGKFTYATVSTPTEVEAMSRKYPTAKVVKVACGANHAAAMDSEGKIYTWGFGGYGRLGHKDNKDQFEPLAVELFSEEPPPPREDIPSFMRNNRPKIRARYLACGSTSTYAVATPPFNYCYLWGITKKAGEANMYPMPIDDVMQMKIRSLASGNTSTILCAGDALVSWGASPTFGELGYGEKSKSKSSTTPQIVKDLNGAITLQVAMGYAHSVAIIDVDDKESKDVLAKLPDFEPPELDVPGESSTGKKRKGAAGEGAGKKKRATKAKKK